MLDYAAVEIWWRYTQSNHRLFFRLVHETPANLTCIPNFEICIHTLENGHRGLMRSICPQEARIVQQYLASATRHLIDSLRKLRDGETEEGADLLGQASLEMDLLQYELMSMGLQ